MKPPRPALFDDAKPAIVLSATAGQVEEAAPIAAAAAGSKPKAGPLKTSLYLNPAVHDVLREIAFQERKKVHDLVIEGLEHVLKTRRHPSTNEIAGKA